MLNDELVTKSAAEMAALVRARKISPVELVEAHLARIEELQPRLNAFVTVDWEGARRQARVAEFAVMQGEPVGALHGLPISIKSSIAVADLPCEAGSRLKQGTIAQQDAVVVARLRQ